MHHLRKPRLSSDKNRASAHAHRLHLEEIESRLLPGEAMGLGLLASLSLFGGYQPLLVRRDENFSVSTVVFRSTEAAGESPPVYRETANDFTKIGRLADQATEPPISGILPVYRKTSPISQADNSLPSPSDPLPAGNPLLDALVNEALDPSSLFAAARPRPHEATPVDDLLGHHQAPVANYPPISLSVASPSSLSGAAPAIHGTGHATIDHSELPGGASIHQQGPVVLPHLNGPSWSSYAHDPQHTAISDVASQSLSKIHWQTPVDQNPQYSGGDLFIHYGSPLVTQANTVIVPVKTGIEDGFEVEAFDGGTGTLKWTVTTDYSVPSRQYAGWTPPLSPVLTPGNRLYIPGAGGTVYYMDNPDAPGATITGQQAFYGISNYDHSYDDKVKISTPLTSDSAGNLYFGFFVTDTTPLNLQSGIARMDTAGNGSWVSARTAAGDSGITQVALNCAPALSNDQSNLYIAVNGGGFTFGYLLRLDTTTLTTTGEVFLLDPSSGVGAILLNQSTSSPTVGPDGDVYFGVYANSFNSNNERGWLLHFSGDLTQTKTAGAFGWDDTASIVPASMVPSYTGSSAYLVMTKYNNYKEAGGDGVNRIAVLDPNAAMVDPISGATVMQEVLTIAGVTPDPELPMVREWCINTAAVDPATNSILANSEDGTLYRWDMNTNSFTQSINLTSATGEAYTPTVIGVDGTVYAINNATLFAVGA